MLFSIVIHKDKDSDYGVTVPDLAGCFSAGDTLEEAVANAREAIELHLEGLLESGEAFEARVPEAHLANPDYAGGIWHLVDVNLTDLRGKATRINITVPERVLGRIDRAAHAVGQNRSAFLVGAGLRYAMGGGKLARDSASGQYTTSRNDRKNSSARVAEHARKAARKK